MINKTLYGLSKTGKTKYWNIRTDGAKIIVTHGQLRGKLQSKEEVVSGKNIGRANETTPADQADREAESKFKKQLDKGYRERLEDLNSLPLLPMLAQDYRHNKDKIKFPCFISAKLDGVRCLAFWENDRIVLLSRGGKEYNVQHIKEALKNLPKNIILDGEIYSNKLDLEDIVSAIKKPNYNTPKLEYIVFDIINNKPFHERLAQLNNIPRTNNIIKYLSYDKIDNEKDIYDCHRHFVDCGYEGTILRNFNGLYEPGKRSADLQKYKEFLDDEFKINDIFEDKNGNAVFELYCPSAKDYFTCTYGDFDQRRKFLNNKFEYIGKFLTVKFQKRYKKTRRPQFPTGVAIRDYE